MLSLDELTLSLKTEFIDGVTLQGLPPERHSRAFLALHTQLALEIYPELHRLRRNRIGPICEDLPVIPSLYPLYDTRKTDWTRKVSATDEFVLCHGDIGQHNILVDKNTFKIEAIIDWEYAGFFLKDFEIDLWKHQPDERDHGACERLEMRFSKFSDYDPRRHEDEDKQPMSLF